MPRGSRLTEAINEGLPRSSEFRSDPRDDELDRQVLRHGRRVTLPLMTDPVDPFGGRLFTSASVQPAPVSIIRKEGMSEEQTTVVYLAWDFTQGVAPPVSPLALALVKWGVGSQVFSRTFDLHRVPRRFAVAANWIEVVGAYVDLGSPGAGASIDACVGLASGEADVNYWTGIWMPPLNGIPPGQMCNQPAAILAMAGTLTSLPAAVAGAYVMAVDCSNVLPAVGAVSGTSRPIPGMVSMLLAPGQGFAFDEDEMPGAFADFGVAIAVSTSPTLFVAPVGATTSVFVQLKAAL